MVISSSILRTGKKALLRQIQSSGAEVYGKTKADFIVDKFGAQLIKEHPKNYAREIQYGAIRDYIVEYGKRNKKLANKLYEENYLDKIDAGTAFILRNINDEYGVKTFLLSGEEPNIAKFIRRELLEYKTASNGKAVLPRVINVTKFDPFQDNWISYGRVDKGKIIYVNEKNNVKSSLRHELMHLNSDTDFLYYSKNVALILSKKFAKSDSSLPFFNEFKKAGIPNLEIKCAYTNPDEFVAVASEGNMSAYSEKFKNVLRLLGMPKWAFDLRKNPLQ